MVLDFIISTYTSAAFLLVFGILFLWVATQKEIVPQRTRNKLLSWKVVLMIFGLLYILLSFTSVYVAQGTSLSWANQAPCENLLVNSTAINATTTTHEYSDSCADRTTPRGVENLFVILSWTVFLNFLALGISIFALVAGALLRW